MVRVVVDDVDAAGFAAPLQPSTRANEAPECALRLRARGARELDRCQRSRGVAPVVLARHSEQARKRFELVASDDLRDLEPTGEELLDLRARGERRVVVQ